MPPPGHGEREPAPRRPRLIASAFCGAVLLVAAAAAGGAADPLTRALTLPAASLVVEEGGRTLIARQADRPMVPASTLKIVTALAAIQRWGLDHRFETRFYRDQAGILWVRGGGDPFLVSEELDRIAVALRARGVRALAGIGTDGGLFAPQLRISGRSGSDNPYDAPVTALAANFNTLSLAVSRGGVRGGEAQTPLTPLARQLGAGLALGRHRVNLREPGLALRYFGELLAAKLRGQGVEVGDRLLAGPVPEDAELLYRHRGSRDLRAVLAAMLEHSNNFIANDLFLLLADEGDGRPLTMAAAQRWFAAWVEEEFGWRGYRIEEGAGLSRNNRVSARQLQEAVKAFAPYRNLLPAQNGRVRAKTGTLRGVSCYAGFVQRKGRWEPFSLMIGQPAPYDLRLQVADALAREPDLERLCPGGSC